MRSDLDLAVEGAAVITDGAMRALPLDAVERALCEEIVAASREDATALRLPRRRRRLPAVAVAVAVVVAVGVLGGVRLSGAGSGGAAWAAGAVRVAEGAPRLLIAEPGWRVTRADEFTPQEGEMTFADGTASAELTWRPRPEGEAYVKDRANSASLHTTTDLLGARADVFRYEGPLNDFTALWLQGDDQVELRGVQPSLDAFLALLHSLRVVGVDDWLSAMPASVVRPIDQADVVAKMLDGVPVPAGFDGSGLAGDGALDRYQLGARVAGAVACAWIDRWVAARKTGDDAAASRAAEAMATSHSWPFLQEMTSEGAYPEVLWQYADAMATGGTVPGGKTLTVEESYRAALGCPGS
jgi:hypothetical protein